MPRSIAHVPSRLRAALAAALALALAAPAAAQAHGLVGRADLPIPPWMFAWVAAGILVGSYAALGRLWTTPQLDGAIARRPGVAFTLPRGWEAGWGAVGLAAFALLVVAGLHGAQDARNMAPTLVFVVFWVGVPIASVLAGDVWALLSPWRTTARAARALVRRRAEIPPPFAMPAWLGRWPAVAGILLFAWLELVYTGRDRPGLLAVLALAYGGTQLVAMASFGIESWSERGDAFAVLFNLFARLSPWERDGRRVHVRRPLSGLADLTPAPGTVALLCATIGSTAFDGLTNGGLWRELSQPLVKALYHAGLSPLTAQTLTRTLGLALTVLAVAGLYRLGVRGMRAAGGSRDEAALSMRFVCSLAPIAFGYLLAHYFSLLVFQGQATAHLVSDPFGRGSDLFGTASAGIDYGAVSAATIWYVQVVALVGGVVVAHDRALGFFGSAREALVSQRWMLMVMVTLTCVGLYLLSAVGT